MIGSLAEQADTRRAAAAGMAAFLAQCRERGPVVILSHFDADGLAAAAILTRALAAAGREAMPLIVGKGETAWDAEMAARTDALGPAGLIVADLGTRAEPVRAGLPTLVVDHHRPTGTPPDAVTLSGNGLAPEPCSALIAWWAAHALGDPGGLLWLAALGMIGDMVPEQAFPELADAQARWGKTALRDATALVNAPRRTAAADPGPALRLLLRGDGPKTVTRGEDADARALVAARQEVSAAVEAARRVAPRIRGDVALLLLDSPCQIHPLIAQQWRGRLKDSIVIAANSGYRPGWVHFAARAAADRDLIAWLAAHRPEGADSRYGNGHRGATGGALPLALWDRFAASIGFPEARLEAGVPA